MATFLSQSLNALTPRHAARRWLARLRLGVKWQMVGRSSTEQASNVVTPGSFGLLVGNDRQLPY
jgi:hypothetical protein